VHSCVVQRSIVREAVPFPYQSFVDFVVNVPSKIIVGSYIRVYIHTQQFRHATNRSVSSPQAAHQIVTSTIQKYLFDSSGTTKNCCSNVASLATMLNSRYILETTIYISYNHQSHGARADKTSSKLKFTQLASIRWYMHIIEQAGRIQAPSLLATSELHFSCNANDTAATGSVDDPN
jgi:hypothetical protein